MFRALDVHVGASLLAAREHRQLGGVRGELEVELLDRSITVAGLPDLKRVPDGR